MHEPEPLNIDSGQKYLVKSFAEAQYRTIFQIFLDAREISAKGERKHWIERFRDEPGLMRPSYWNRYAPLLFPLQIPKYYFVDLLHLRRFIANESMRESAVRKWLKRGSYCG